MKKFGFMLMAAATLAFAVTSCKKDQKPGGDDIVVPPTPDEGEVKVPTVEATDGAVTLLIHFVQAPCDGYEIRFVGDHAENGWNIADAPAMEAIGDGWYKYLVRAKDGAESMSGRPIQAKADDADWSHDWSHDPAMIEDIKGVKDGMKATNEFGETNLNFTAADAADAAIVVFNCKAWNVSPCAAATKYALTLKAPAFCGEEYDVEVVGSFEGWGAAPVKMNKNGNVYTAEIEAKAGDQIKFRGHVDDPEKAWSVQVEGVNEDQESEHFDEFMEMPNQSLGAELNVTFDWSNPDKFRWNICGGGEEAE